MNPSDQNGMFNKSFQYNEDDESETNIGRRRGNITNNASYAYNRELDPIDDDIEASSQREFIPRVVGTTLKKRSSYSPLRNYNENTPQHRDKKTIIKSKNDISPRNIALKMKRYEKIAQYDGTNLEDNSSADQSFQGSDSSYYSTRDLSLSESFSPLQSIPEHEVASYHADNRLETSNISDYSFKSAVDNENPDHIHSQSFLDVSSQPRSRHGTDFRNMSINEEDSNFNKSSSFYSVKSNNEFESFNKTPTLNKPPLNLDKKRGSLRKRYSLESSEGADHKRLTTLRNPNTDDRNMYKYHTASEIGKYSDFSMKDYSDKRELIVMPESKQTLSENLKKLIAPKKAEIIRISKSYRKPKEIAISEISTNSVRSREMNRLEEDLDSNKVIPFGKDVTWPMQDSSRELIKEFTKNKKCGPSTLNSTPINVATKIKRSISLKNLVNFGKKCKSDMKKKSFNDKEKMEADVRPLKTSKASRRFSLRSPNRNSGSFLSLFNSKNTTENTITDLSKLSLYDKPHWKFPNKIKTMQEDIDAIRNLDGIQSPLVSRNTRRRTNDSELVGESSPRKGIETKCIKLSDIHPTSERDISHTEVDRPFPRRMIRHHSCNIVFDGRRSQRGERGRRNVKLSDRYPPSESEIIGQSSRILLKRSHSLGITDYNPYVGNLSVTERTQSPPPLPRRRSNRFPKMDYVPHKPKLKETMETPPLPIRRPYKERLREEQQPEKTQSPPPLPRRRSNRFPKMDYIPHKPKLKETMGTPPLPNRRPCKERVREEQQPDISDRQGIFRKSNMEVTSSGAVGGFNNSDNPFVRELMGRADAAKEQKILQSIESMSSGFRDNIRNIRKENENRGLIPISDSPTLDEKVERKSIVKSTISKMKKSMRKIKDDKTLPSTSRVSAAIEKIRKESKHMDITRLKMAPFLHGHNTLNQDDLNPLLSRSQSTDQDDNCGMEVGTYSLQGQPENHPPERMCIVDQLLSPVSAAIEKMRESKPIDGTLRKISPFLPGHTTLYQDDLNPLLRRSQSTGSSVRRKRLQRKRSFQ